MVALEKLRCVPVIFAVAAKITAHTVNCTGTHRNFYVPEVPNVHMNENNKSVYFFRRIFFQAV